MVARIIDDEGKEIREQDFVIAQTTDMHEASLAVINEIAATYVDMTFVDVLLGSKPKKYRIKDILSMQKSKG